MDVNERRRGTSNRCVLIHPVLERVVDGVIRETPFQRALATCYASPLIPGDPDSSARVIDVAFRGLAKETKAKALARFLEGLQVSGDRYRESHRMGDSFFYPQGLDLPGASTGIPSSRRYLSHNEWHEDDLLLVPFWSDGRILGQLSVDDPRNGARPRRIDRTLLEEIAALTALALQDAVNLEQLSETHHLFKVLANCDMTGLVVVQDQEIRYANDRLVVLLGYERTSLEALSPWWNFVHPDDRPLIWDQRRDPTPTGQIMRAIRKDGRVIWLSVCAHQVSFSESEAVAFQFYDITDRVRTEELLREKALRDPLTGFHNRGYFEDAIQIELQRSRRYRRAFTLMMADLANFKQVNDRLGHQEGDRVLAGVAAVIRQGLRDSDWIVRYGGDEFLLVLPETGIDIKSLVDRLREDVARWGRENIEGVDVGIDFGWATWRSDRPQGIDDLIGEADQMLYARKRRHKTSNVPPETVGSEPSNHSEPPA